MTRALVAFGGNLGDRVRHLREGRHRLEATPGWTLRAASSLFETAPEGGSPQGPYLNACALFEVEDGPRGVLARLLAVEAEAGRERSVAGAPRTLDLDLLLFGGDCIDEPGLRVPHPRMTARAFVLAPAAEIAGELVHPPSGLTLRACAEGLRPWRGVALHAPPEAWS